MWLQSYFIARLAEHSELVVVRLLLRVMISRSVAAQQHVSFQLGTQHVGGDDVMGTAYAMRVSSDRTHLAKVQSKLRARFTK